MGQDTSSDGFSFLYQESYLASTWLSVKTSSLSSSRLYGVCLNQRHHDDFANMSVSMLAFTAKCSVFKFRVQNHTSVPDLMHFYYSSKFLFSLGLQVCRYYEGCRCPFWIDTISGQYQCPSHWHDPMVTAVLRWSWGEKSSNCEDGFIASFGN